MTPSDRGCRAQASRESRTGRPRLAGIGLAGGRDFVGVIPSEAEESPLAGGKCKPAALLTLFHSAMAASGHGRLFRRIRSSQRVGWHFPNHRWDVMGPLLVRRAKDCFVASAPRNDNPRRGLISHRSFRATTDIRRDRFGFYARMPVCPYARMPVCPYARMPVCPYARMPLCPSAAGCPRVYDPLSRERRAGL
jgi:hypothetical protein